MSGFFRPRNLAVAGGAVSILFIVPTLSGGSTSFNPFHTKEAQNITDRFNSGGGSETHTPGVASPRGGAKKDQILGPRQTRNGPDSPKFRDGHEAQRVGSQNALGKAWSEAHYGNEKGR